MRKKANFFKNPILFEKHKLFEPLNIYTILKTLCRRCSEPRYKQIRNKFRINARNSQVLYPKNSKSSKRTLFAGIWMQRWKHVIVEFFTKSTTDSRYASHILGLLSFRCASIESDHYTYGSRE